MCINITKNIIYNCASALFKSYPNLAASVWVALFVLFNTVFYVYCSCFGQFVFCFGKVKKIQNKSEIGVRVLIMCCVIYTDKKYPLNYENHL